MLNNCSSNAIHLFECTTAKSYFTNYIKVSFVLTVTIAIKSYFDEMHASPSFDERKNNEIYHSISYRFYIFMIKYIFLLKQQTADLFIPFGIVELNNTSIIIATDEKIGVFVANVGTHRLRQTGSSEQIVQ